MLSIFGCALAGDARTLTILAAASLRESFKELAHTFEASHPGEHVRITFAGSQQLAASILSGAPADVFASADELQTKRVVSGGKAGYVTALCSNRLVVAVNKKSANQIHSIADLGRPGLRVVLAKIPVPAGVYSEKLL